MWLLRITRDPAPLTGARFEIMYILTPYSRENCVYQTVIFHPYPQPLIPVNRHWKLEVTWCNKLNPVSAHHKRDKQERIN